MRGVTAILTALVAGLLITSCSRQASPEQRQVTVIDLTGSVVDVDYRVNGVDGGSFSFEIESGTNGSQRLDERELPVLTSVDMLELTPRMINGFSGTTTFDLSLFEDERTYLLIDKNGDVVARTTRPTP